MSWYYAENNERRGPVEEAAFQTLVSAGTIKPDTLVWRDGMANWLPLSESGYQVRDPQSAADSTAPVGGVPMGVCSESGRILPRSELVEIDGRLVSAEYKNVVLQRIREGVGASGTAADPETIAQQILARGYDLSIGSCVSRGWGLIKANFWLTTGATFLVYFVIMAAGIVPLGSLVVQGPLIGGLYWMMLKLIRNEPASVNDAFQGFNRGWGQLVAVSIMSLLIMLACLLPGVLVVIAGTAGHKEALTAAVLIGGVLVFVGFLVATYFTIAWIFALLLVVDRRIEFWPAMKLSRRVVGLHWWQVFGVLFVTGMVVFALMFIGILLVALLTGLVTALAGKGSALAAIVPILMFLAVFVGLFSLLPLGFCTIAVAYEDIFGTPATR